jgi:hypothetical protein
VQVMHTGLAARTVAGAQLQPGEQHSKHSSTDMFTSKHSCSYLLAEGVRGFKPLSQPRSPVSSRLSGRLSPGTHCGGTTAAAAAPCLSLAHTATAGIANRMLIRSTLCQAQQWQAPCFPS